MTGIPAEVMEGYTALRDGIGAYRLGRDVVLVTGPDAGSYLQGQCSQDLAALAPGASAPSLVLEPDGKLTALVRVTRLTGDRWSLDTDAGAGEAVAARLTRFRLRVKADIEQVEWPCVALRGAGVGSAAGAEVGPERPTENGPWILPVEWNGTSGVDLLGPGAEELVPDGAQWCGPEAWEALRVQAGIPAMGSELDGRTIAAEAHLVDRAVSFTKGCYTGQELVARLDARGSRVARRLCGIVPAPGLDPTTLADAVLWPLDEADAGRSLGSVTSAAWCPPVGGAAGIGYVHRSVAAGTVVTWVPAAGPGEMRRATVTDLPIIG